MKEVITIGQANMIVIGFAIAVFTAAILLAVITKKWIKWLSVSLAGPLAFVMWKVFNWLTQLNGLDTMANFYINLLLFVIIGGIIGVIAAIAVNRKPKISQNDTSEISDLP